MVKTFHFCYRKKGMTHEECIKYHREVHTALIKSIFGPKLKKYVGHYLKEAVGQSTIKRTQADLPYDMIVEIWFDDETWNSFGEFLKTPDGRRVQEDEENFIDRKKLFAVVFDDYVIV